MPTALKRSVTWDRCIEMTSHRRFTDWSSAEECTARSVLLGSQGAGVAEGDGNAGRVVIADEIADRPSAEPRSKTPVEVLAPRGAMTA